jgi:hypothetical protein
MIQAAELYAEGSAAGSRRLHAEVAEALGRTPARVREDVCAARREGSVTPKARAIFDGLGAPEETVPES